MKRKERVPHQSLRASTNGVLELSGDDKGVQESTLVRHEEFEQWGPAGLRKRGKSCPCQSVPLRLPKTLLSLVFVRASPSRRVPEDPVFTYVDSTPQWAALLPARWMLMRSPQPFYISGKILWGKFTHNTQRQWLVKFLAHNSVTLIHFSHCYCSMGHSHMTGMSTQLQAVVLTSRVSNWVCCYSKQWCWGSVG